uniref:WGS project CBMI000000000 data, contig CS3069_c001105 n=1 Tax=Fusarium clavum TaxID=2594811 RepID=A0A090MBA2_9HYPO|nr:unnamed protein product [Fusarium clavum]
MHQPYHTCSFHSNDLLFSHVAQLNYPDLPLDEAFAKHWHDKFVKEPAELARNSAAFAGQYGLDLLELPAIAYGNPWGLAAVSLGRIAKRVLTTPSTASTQTPTSASGHRTQNLSLAMAGQTHNIASGNLVREIHGIHIIGNSLVDRINYYGRWMQTVTTIQIAQQNQIIQDLKVMCGHLRDANTITVSGGSGPDGFARPVYDFIERKINDVDPTERQNHRYFLYHPDTNWYGAFSRLIRDRPLPAEFCAKSDNLDTICRFMGDIRRTLIEERTNGKEIHFHLLIPSWYSIVIREPSHFPDSIHPLSVVGEKHKGKELVEMNLPAAPPQMLDGIANVLDPNHSNKIAEGVSTAVTLPVVGWGVNGACLALGTAVGTFTGLGMLIAVPIWWGTALPAMGVSAPLMLDAIHSSLCEERPRILGSTDRLGVD